MILPDLAIVGELPRRQCRAGLIFPPVDREWMTIQYQRRRRLTFADEALERPPLDICADVLRGSLPLLLLDCDVISRSYSLHRQQTIPSCYFTAIHSTVLSTAYQ